jgi:hypothetical protein
MSDFTHDVSLAPKANRLNRIWPRAVIGRLERHRRLDMYLGLRIHPADRLTVAWLVWRATPVDEFGSLDQQFGIDGIKAKKIPAKKSGVIDCSIATMVQFETIQC